MDEMDQKLGAILNNPQMMQQIMSMAQALGGSQEQPQQPAPPPQPAPAANLPEIDLATVQKLAGLAGQSGIDREQQALLKALSPYLSRDRIARLERAMRAAKTAKLASSVLGQGGLSFLSGR